MAIPIPITAKAINMPRVRPLVSFVGGKFEVDDDEDDDDDDIIDVDDKLGLDVVAVVGDSVCGVRVAL